MITRVPSVTRENETADHVPTGVRNETRRKCLEYARLHYYTVERLLHIIIIVLGVGRDLPLGLHIMFFFLFKINIFIITFITQ